MTNGHRRIAVVAAAGLIGTAAVFLWVPDDEAAQPSDAVVSSVEVPTTSMGAAPALQPVLATEIWNRFHHEKSTALEVELPAQF